MISASSKQATSTVLLYTTGCCQSWCQCHASFCYMRLPILSSSSYVTYIARHLCCCPSSKGYAMYYLLLPTLFQKCDVTTTFDVHLVAPRTEYTNFVFERIVRMTPPPPFFKKRSMMTDSYSEVWRSRCRRAQKVEGLVFRLLAIRSIMNEGWFCEVAAFPANMLLPQPK